jgi:hypothetical protein
MRLSLIFVIGCATGFMMPSWIAFVLMLAIALLISTRTAALTNR